jgi:hypothetical protein
VNIYLGRLNVAAVTAQGASFSLPAPDGLEICKVLGLAMSNVAMYGMAHSVTATAVSQAFDLIIGRVDLYGEIEFVLGEAGLIVNGSVIDTERSTGQLLVDQLTKLGVHDFAFVPPVNRSEFNRFVSILSAPPGSTLVVNGFEAAVAEAKLKSVRVANVSYARVDKDVPPPAQASSPSRSSGRKRFDLDLDMGEGELAAAASPFSPVSQPGVGSAVSDYLEQRATAETFRQNLLSRIRETAADPSKLGALQEQLLAAGLSTADWDELLAATGAARDAGVVGGAQAGDQAVRRSEGESGSGVAILQCLLLDVDALAAQGEAIAAGRTTQAMNDILESIRREVLLLSSQTTQHVDDLAERVDADRETVATLEEDARARGVGPNLSRDELLASLAEINQELAQPLSAASAVIELLGSGKLGDVTDAQRDVLAVAFDGTTRLGQLVEYLNKISGLPENFSPDHEILDAAYKR